MTIRTTLFFLAILFMALSATAQKSTPSTEMTVPSDTTKYQPPATQKPEPKDPKLELPDILILGKDEYHRTVKNKKEITPESPALIRKEAAYEPMSTWFRRDAKKPHFDQADSLTIRQIWATIKGGSYLTFVGDAGYWQRLKQGDAAAYAWFDRSEGQFDNTKYGQGGLSGKFSYDVAPKVKSLFTAEYSRYGRGLHNTGYHVNNAVRDVGSGLFSAELQYDVNKLSDGNIGVEFGGLAMTSDTSSQEIDKSDQFYYDVHFGYTTLYKKTQFQAKGQYIRETLDTKADSMRSQTGFGLLGLEILQPLSNTFSAALGVDFHAFSQDTLAFKTRLSPYARLNFIPSAQVGLSLQLSTGFKHHTFIDSWQENAYISHRLPQAPSDEKFGIKLKGDVEITEHIKFHGSFYRQWMNETYYWQADTTTGLINRHPIADTKLSEIELGIIAEISEKTRLQVSYIDYADHIPFVDDSLKTNANINRLPYRPDFRIPIRASIQLLPEMNLTLTADVLGQRKKNIYSDDTFPTYALFHVDLKYEIHKNAIILLSVHNLLDTKHSIWEGYPEMGIVLLGGVRVRF